MHVSDSLILTPLDAEMERNLLLDKFITVCVIFRLTWKIILVLLQAKGYCEFWVSQTA